MKKIIASIAVAAILGNAVAQTTKPVTTSSGLVYEILSSKNGKKINVGNNVTVHYTGKLTNDSVFDSSIPRKQPFKFKLGQGQVIKGWDEGIAYLHIGDKARFTIPPHLGYGDRATGKIPAKATLIFDVEVIDAQEPIVAVPYNVKGKDTIKTASGLKYILLNANPKGIKPEIGKNVLVHYTGYLTSGKKFDSSVERGEPLEFVLGKGNVIKGWDEAIALMHIGEKAQLIIPHSLAYGESGAGGGIIPPNATLIFDVELMDVK